MRRKNCSVAGAALFSIVLMSSGTLRADRPPAQHVRGEFAPARAVHQAGTAKQIQLHRGLRGHVPPVRWGAVDREKLRREDALRDGVGGLPMRVGIERPSPVGLITPQADGQWTQASDGSPLWTIKLDSPDAEGIRVHFSRFDLPLGARVVVSDAGGMQTYSYEGVGPIGKRRFWSNVIDGDAAYVQYQPPSEAAQPPNLEIDRISHIYREPAEGQESLLLPCQEDVNCHDVDSVAQASVARIVFQDGGSFLCSGGLLADSDPNTFAGYFLTANHCISRQSVADTVEARWFYETTSCNGPTTFGPTSLGSVLLATSETTDFTFLRLIEDPDAGQGFAAWNAASSAPTEPVTGIHHPGGSWKRVSFGSLTTEPPICSQFGLGLDKFWYLDWFEGITEQGSSGSPLFNAEWEVVGQLFGACLFEEPNCNNQDRYNVVYGRFDQTFPSIQSWLQAAPATDDEFEDNDEVEQAALLGQGDHDLYLVDLFDYFAVELCEEGEGLRISATYDHSEMDLDMQLVTTGGLLVAIAPETGGTEVVDAALPPGTYVVKIIKERGWGGPYVLNVTIPNNYGDLDGDGTPGVSDVMCVIDVASGNPSTCTFQEADVIPCGGDGTVNLFDVLAVVRATGGDQACGGCP